MVGHKLLLTNLYCTLFKAEKRIMFHLLSADRVKAARAIKFRAFKPIKDNKSTTRFCFHCETFVLLSSAE